jgi:hypothetical protein
VTFRPNFFSGGWWPKTCELRALVFNKELDLSCNKIWFDLYRCDPLILQSRLHCPVKSRLINFSQIHNNQRRTIKYGRHRMCESERVVRSNGCQILINQCAFFCPPPPEAGKKLGAIFCFIYIHSLFTLALSESNIPCARKWKSQVEAARVKSSP